MLLCPVGTIKSRLATARDRLRRRLERRNLPMSSGSVGLALQGGLPMTTVPAPLPAPTLQAILRNANGGPTPASISYLTNGVLETMLWHRLISRLGVAAAILIGTASLATGAIGLARRNGDMPADGEQQVAAPAPAVAQPITPTMKPTPEDPLPAGATLRFGTPRYRHPSAIVSLAVSPDGKIAVANSGEGFDGAVRTYDLATGRAMPIIDRGGIDGGMALSPDGKTLAVARAWSPNAVQLFDMATGAETARISYPDVNPGSASSLLMFSPDGTYLVTQADGGKALHLIGLAKREVVRRFPCPGTVFAAALSPDGKNLVVGGFDYDVNTKRGWFANRLEVDTGRELDRLPLSNGGIRSVAYSPDGATIAVGDGEIKVPSVTLIEAATGKARLRIPLPDTSWIVQSLAFSPDGRTLAASGGPSTRLFDTATGKELLKIDRGAIGLRFSPDGATLVGAVAATIDRWDTTTGQSLIPEGGNSSIDQIAVTADGDRIVTRGWNGDAHIWDARTGAASTSAGAGPLRPQPGREIPRVAGGRRDDPVQGRGRPEGHAPRKSAADDRRGLWQVHRAVRWVRGISSQPVLHRQRPDAGDGRSRSGRGGAALGRGDGPGRAVVPGAGAGGAMQCLVLPAVAGGEGAGGEVPGAAGIGPGRPGCHEILGHREREGAR